MENTGFLEDLKNNQARAQNHLINLYWDAVYGFMMNRLQDPYLADELTVLVFGKAITGIQTFDTKRDLGVWLMFIAKNALIDHYRAHKNQEFQYLDLEDVSERISPSPEEMLIAEQNSEEILKAIGNMDEIYKTVIELRFLDELSIREISEKLQISESNTKVRIMRAKSLLAASLSKFLH